MYKKYKKADLVKALLERDRAVEKETYERRKSEIFVQEKRNALNTKIETISIIRKEMWVSEIEIIIADRMYYIKKIRYPVDDYIDLNYSEAASTLIETIAVPKAFHLYKRETYMCTDSEIDVWVSVNHEELGNNRLKLRVKMFCENPDDEASIRAIEKELS